MGKYGFVLPFLAGMAVGVVFNDQIRQVWGMVQGAVPQLPSIPSFGGGMAPAPEPEPVDNTGAGNVAYAYKADFDREYESHSQTTNNGIPFY